MQGAAQPRRLQAWMESLDTWSHRHIHMQRAKRAHRSVARRAAVADSGIRPRLGDAMRCEPRARMIPGRNPAYAAAAAGTAQHRTGRRRQTDGKTGDVRNRDLTWPSVLNTALLSRSRLALRFPRFVFIFLSSRSFSPSMFAWFGLILVSL
jgi:hypothetical protein